MIVAFVCFTNAGNMSKRIPKVKVTMVAGQPNPETEFKVSKVCAKIVEGFIGLPSIYSNALIPLNKENDLTLEDNLKCDGLRSLEKLLKIINQRLQYPGK